MVRDFAAFNGQHFGPLHTTINEVESINPPPILEFKGLTSRFSYVCQHIHRDHSVGIFYGKNPLHYSTTLFFLEIVCVILITQIVRFLLKPLRQPRIVSEIIGGIIIGPSVLGHSKGFTNHLFPQNARIVINTVGELGFMYFLFVTGVKMDLTQVKNTGKKHWYTALIGMAFPLVIVSITGFILRPLMDNDLSRISSIGGIASGLSITAFPVIYLILKEFNLLSSEVGRMALSTALVGDVVGICAVVLFEAYQQADINKRYALCSVISLIIFVSFLLMVVRPTMNWIIQSTPEGKSVGESYVIIILVAVVVMGFVTDMFGIALANGPFWLGLVIPDGPPLGATLVERSETITMEILMPISFASLGLLADVHSMASYNWLYLLPLFAMVVTGYVVKFVSTMGAAMYFNHTFKDAATLSLIMNLRGQVEFLVFLHWIDKKIIVAEMYTMLVILTTVMTGVITPIISILYDPTRPYMVNKRRTIQHTPPETDLRVLVCIHDKESITGLINLLEISHPTKTNPISIYLLHLIELIGRATPALIDHEQPAEGPYEDADHETIRNSFDQFKETRKDYVTVHSFTAVTAKQSMHQDICELALTRKINLIILPFAVERLDNLAGTELMLHGSSKQSVNSNVLEHAPCSVALLVDKGIFATSSRTNGGHSSKRHALQKYVLLFLGGSDAREALNFADRVAMNRDISLSVIRFLSHNNKGDDVTEKKLDDGVVTWFWVKNEGNNRVTYREVVVKNGNETVSAIQALNDGKVDLWIVGRKHGTNPVILQGMSTWSENCELGLIGDLVTSDDFGSTGSVLVFQQQIMREQGMADATDSGSSLPGFVKFKTISNCSRMFNRMKG